MLKLFITERQLAERDRIVRLEAVLDAHDARMLAHEEDCLKIRETTRDEIMKLRDSIEENHADWRKVVASQHRDNVGRLRWQNGLLITILLGLAGFMGEQVWTKVFTH